MKIYKPKRFSGPLWLSIPGIVLISLFLGFIYTFLYNGNPLFRTVLPYTWWLWMLPCLPIMWLFWVVADIIVALCIRNKQLEVIDCEIDSERESILIKIKPINFNKLSEEKIAARFEYIYHGGLPRCFKHQKAKYDEPNNLYEVKIDALGLLKSIQIKNIYIYIKQGEILSYHCIYLIHKFKYKWSQWLEDNK